MNKKAGYIGYEQLINASKKFLQKDIELENGGKVGIQELSGGVLSDMNETDGASNKLALVLKHGLVNPKLLDLSDAKEMVEKNYKVANEIGIEILTLSGVINPEKN